MPSRKATEPAEPAAEDVQEPEPAPESWPDPGAVSSPGPGQVVVVANVKWNGLIVGAPTVVEDTDELRSAESEGLVTVQ